jgi:hypothetical protein
MTHRKEKGKKKPGYFYGWNIVAASFLAHLAYAEHFATVLGLFFRLNASSDGAGAPLRVYRPPLV